MSPLLTGFAFGGSSGSGIVASGGTKTTDGNYSVHTFTSSGTFTVTANPNNESFDILCIGGGAGGNAGYDFTNPPGFARPGNGGGGGGVMFDVRKLSATSYTVTVGAAGTGGNSGNSYQATSGGNTSFDTLQATGGSAPLTGGTLSYLFNGANGGYGNDTFTTSNGGAGAQGYSGSISGSATTYIGGGGGGGGCTAGTGGNGGGNGGKGGNGNDQNGTSATGYGGGGGGGGANYQGRGAYVSNGGNGTAGIVIVRYRS